MEVECNVQNNGQNPSIAFKTILNKDDAQGICPQLSTWRPRQYVGWKWSGGKGVTLYHSLVLMELDLY